MDVFGTEVFDQDDRETLALLGAVAAGETYGYDKALLAATASMGLLDSDQFVGLEAIDPNEKDGSEVRNAASGRVAKAKAKFDERLDKAHDEVGADISDIQKRLNSMSDKEKKALPWGKIGAGLGVLDGVRKYFQARKVMSAVHESLTSAGKEAISSHVADLKAQIPKIQAELDAAKKAGAAGAANVSGLEAQLKNTQSALFSAKSDGDGLMRAVAGAKMNFAGKAAMFVACIAWYAFVWWLTVKVVVAIVRWIKKMVSGSAN